MGALSGSLGERTKAAIAAGCELLHCNGKMAEMLAVAAAAPQLAGEAAPGRSRAGAAKTGRADRHRRAPRRILQLMAGSGARTGSA